MLGTGSNLGEFRLLLEELCCDLCRFEHTLHDGLAPEAVRIDREYWLSAGAFADIRVAPRGQPPYFVEVRYGYTNEQLVRNLSRKYGSAPSPNAALASKVVLVVDRTSRHDWERLQRELVSVLRSGLTLDVWDEPRLLTLLANCFGIHISGITPDTLLDARQAIDRAKGFHAFGGPSAGAYDHDPAQRGVAVALRLLAAQTAAQRRTFIAPRHPSARAVQGCCRVAGGPLLVFELCPRHERCGSRARESHGLLLEGQVSNHQQRRDVVSVRRRRGDRTLRHTRSSRRVHRRGAETPLARCVASVNR